MPTEAIYLPARKTVRFAIYPGGHEGPRILAEIKEQALIECFGSSDSARELVETYQANFIQIQSMALKMYAQLPLTPIGLTKEAIEQMRKDSRNALIG